MNEQKIDVSCDLGVYNRLRAFLSQIFDYGNTDIEKRFIFYKRLIPLLDFGRDTVDLSKVVLTHHTLRNKGQQALDLKHGESSKLPPMSETGSGGVFDKERLSSRKSSRRSMDSLKANCLTTTGWST